MGTRHEDQPPEHWAGAGSLDPTPVWKQYLLIGLGVLGTLVLVIVVAYFALGVQLATPPAAVAGGRVVLALSEIPRRGEAAKRYGPPLTDAAHAFAMVQVSDGRIFAVPLGTWDALTGGLLRVVPDTDGPVGFDRYGVSVEGDRVVVNTSRVIRGFERVAAPTDPTFR
ncbi:MAG TPA: hypothetical protein VIN34_09630 [Candidatus Limnocylindria bacterium]|jgi:hypothetical protein